MNSIEGAAEERADGEAVARIAGWTPSARLLWAVVAVVGLLTFLPGLTAPFQLDDHIHAAMARGTFPSPRGPTELYDFVGDRDRALLLDRGVLPWWSHPALTIRFFRPLSSAILWASHRAFGERALPMHAVSLAWWLLAVVAVHRLVARRFSPRVAAIATVVFALSPCHALPLAWLANFEVLVSVALGVLALDAYLRWRRAPSLLGGAAATLLFALALLAGEYGLSFAGYVLAYELVARGERLGSRARGLVPFVAPAAAYLAVRAGLGCGSVGSGFYTDPLRDPVGFLHKAPFRLAALLDDAWLSFGSETWSRGTPRPLAFAILAVGVVACFVPIRRAIAALDAERRSTALVFFLGSLLALAPVLSVKPSPRVLGASAVGVSLVVAIVIDHAWFPRALPERRGLAELGAVVATLLGFLHLVHAPIVAFAQGLEARRAGLDFAAHVTRLRADRGGDGRRELVVVRGFAEMFFAPFALDPGGALPTRWRVLSQTGHVLMVRDDARSFDLVVGDADCLTSSGPDDLFRGEAAPVRAGETFALPGLRARVLAANALGATRVRFTFDEDLDASRATWVNERVDGFERATIPAPGYGRPFDP